MAAGATAKPVNDWQTVAPNDWQTVSGNSTSNIATPPKPGMIDAIRGNVNEVQKGATPSDNPIMGALKNFGAGGADVIHSLGHAVMHPLEALTPHTQTPEENAEAAKPLGQQLRDSGSALSSGVSNIVHNPARTAGQIGTGLVLGEAGGEALGAAGKAGSAIRTAAIGDPDAAAVRGLKIPAGSPKMQRTLSSVQTARPYLQGVESQADLQARIPAAKAEVWGPYQQAVDASKNLQVKGPDGPTTIGSLESERLQLSALNRALKMREPEAIQLAQQKGMSQAQLLGREKAVQAALDPELTKLGIKPQEIRKTFGSIAQIGQRVSGKSNIIEPPTPYGFSKLKDISITKPLSNVPTILSAGRDIAAGRYMSASPIDTGIREGFRVAGPKPDLGQYTPPAIRGQISAGAIRMPAPEGYQGPPMGYRPPPIAATTTPMRTGRLLPASSASPELPMTSHPGFEEQLPNSRLVKRGKIIEGKK